MMPIAEDTMPLMLKVALHYGVSTAIALFLVWFMASNLSSDVRATKDALQQHIAEQRFYLSAICVNTARDDAQRATCFRLPLGIDH